MEALAVGFEPVAGWPLGQRRTPPRPSSGAVGLRWVRFHDPRHFAGTPPPRRERLRGSSWPAAGTRRLAPRSSTSTPRPSAITPSPRDWTASSSEVAPPAADRPCPRPESRQIRECMGSARRTREPLPRLRRKPVTRRNTGAGDGNRTRVLSLGNASGRTGADAYEVSWLVMGGGPTEADCPARRCTRDGRAMERSDLDACRPGSPVVARRGPVVLHPGRCSTSRP